MRPASFLALALLLGFARPGFTQSREIQRHEYDDPEGRLMAFYAAALAVSAIGATEAGRPWSVSAGIELSHIPRLNRQQRTAGFDKPESSNLSPVLPRPRLALGTPGGFRVEGSWLPPIAVFDAEANLYAIAVSRAIATRGGFVVAPRVAIAAGQARGAITCNDALQDGTSSERVYYGAVCHGRQSDDHFDPRQISAEMIISRRLRSALVPFMTVGVRRDDTRFDIGVRRADGSRDPDHPILVMRAVRPIVAGGATWGAGRMSAGAEVYYAPGSLVTARVRFDVVLNPQRGPARGT